MPAAPTPRWTTPSPRSGCRTLENLRPAFVITDPEGLEHLSALDLCGARAVLYTDLAAAEPDRDRVMTALDQVIDTDPCYIMYTSGSTGVPKGVAVPHRGVLEYARAVADTFGHEIPCWASSPVPL